MRRPESACGFASEPRDSVLTFAFLFLMWVGVMTLRIVLVLLLLPAALVYSPVQAHRSAELVAELQGSIRSPVHGLTFAPSAVARQFELTVRPSRFGGLNVLWSLPGAATCARDAEGQVARCRLYPLRRVSRSRSSWDGIWGSISTAWRWPESRQGVRFAGVEGADAPVWILVREREEGVSRTELLAHSHVQPDLAPSEPVLPVFLHTLGIPPSTIDFPTVCSGEVCPEVRLDERAFIPWIPRAGSGAKLILTPFMGWGFGGHEVAVRVRESFSSPLYEAVISSAAGPHKVDLADLDVRQEGAYSLRIEASHPLAVVAKYRNPAGCVTILPVIVPRL